MRIPVPGLAKFGSQMAVPITVGERVKGVLYVESPREMRFSWDDEDALVALSDFLALTIRSMERCSEAADEPTAGAAAAAKAAVGEPVHVCFYRADQSVFINNDYLIKGVAGATLWKLLCDYTALGREEFTNRELRHDTSLRLPDVVDNLEARLILWQRRLIERCDVLAIYRRVVVAFVCASWVRSICARRSADENR